MILQKNISLAPYTTFRVGGPARFFAAVSTEEELGEVFRLVHEKKLSVFILGGGSNILFSDRGFDGLVVRLENAAIMVDGTRIMAEAGATLSDVIATARGHSLGGLEKMAGIPGSFGGAVWGNAGAFGTEIGGFIQHVRAFDREAMGMKTFDQQACEFRYRTSIFKKQPQLLVFSALLELHPGKKEEIARIMEETIAKREARHPQDAQCAGSFFMNPVVTDEKLRAEFARDTDMAVRADKLPAGWLIDYVGLRGKKIGGAVVSTIHPNYILNTGDATAEDITILTSLIKQRVRTQLGIQLKEEVQMVGF